jgi:hypothetical protein
MNSGFRREVAENCGLLDYYAASNNTEERNSHHILVLAKRITCHGYALAGLHKTTVASYSSNLTSRLYYSAQLTPLVADFETK